MNEMVSHKNEKEWNLEKNELAKQCWEAGQNCSWDQKKVVVKSRLIPGTIKETIHSLRNPKHINKISYKLSEVWLPNLW